MARREAAASTWSPCLISKVLDIHTYNELSTEGEPLLLAYCSHIPHSPDNGRKRATISGPGVEGAFPTKRNEVATASTLPFCHSSIRYI